MNKENIANNRNRALYWQIYTKRKSVPNRNNPFAATRWSVLGCPLNATVREPNQSHGQMNFPFALPGNPNMSSGLFKAWLGLEQLPIKNDSN